MTLVPDRGVAADGAMAATSHPLATRAAIDVLRDGGNAVDAAVAAAAVLGVVEPQASGIGGDCFALVVPGLDLGRIIAYNGSGRAPGAARAEWFAERGMARIPPESPHAVTIPGAVEAWARLVADHGTRGLAALLRPAIDVAERGFAVTPRVAAAWARGAERLRHDPTARRMLLPGDEPPPAGRRFRRPALAATLRRIAERGPGGFYEGEVAADLVGLLRVSGGLHTLEDFSRTRGDYVEPIQGRFRGRVTVWECPPNGQGVVALQMLAILDGFSPAAGALDPRRLHVFAEASRLALADRDALLADPEAAPRAVEALLDEARVARLRGAIDPERASAGSEARSPQHRDTTHLAVVDRGRTAVSLISSVFHPFGSGLVGPRSGVLLHNRGSGFVLEPGHPNVIAPGKRPLHTIIPAVASVPGLGVLAFGVTGMDYQPPGQAWLLANVVDHGLDLQAAVDLPRVQALPDRLLVEAGVPARAAAALRALGHRVAAAAEAIGSAQAIAVDPASGALGGAADARRDGTVMSV